MGISPGVDQFRINAQSIAGALHRAFNNISDVELTTDLPQVTLDATLVLTRAGVTNDFQVGDLGKIGKDLILHSIGEVGVLFVGA